MNTAAELLKKYDNKEINDKEFLNAFGKAQVFYSTPYGDNKDGGQKLFLLPGPDGTGYHAVCSSRERLSEFYDKLGREGYLIMEGTFASVLQTVKAINVDAPVKMGIIIDPGYSGITVDVAALDTVIEMTEAPEDNDLSAEDIEPSQEDIARLAAYERQEYKNKFWISVGVFSFLVVGADLYFAVLAKAPFIETVVKLGRYAALIYAIAVFIKAKKLGIKLT